MSSHAEQELLENTQQARTNPFCVATVKTGQSPSEAEKIALDNEYNLNLVRETRYLAILKRDFPQIFEDCTKNIDTSLAREKTRIFPCFYGFYSSAGESDATNHGKLVVTPHHFLPPVFWGYDFYDSDGEIKFSTNPDAILPHKTDGSIGFYSHLAVGSRSLPVDLVLRFTFSYGDNQRELVFERRLQSGQFRWRRIIPEKWSDNTRCLESYERTAYKKNGSNNFAEITFRRLLPKEIDLLGGVNFQPKKLFGLFLESWISELSVRFKFSSLYKFNTDPYEWTDPVKNEPMVSKVEEFGFPHDSWPGLQRSKQVLISCYPKEELSDDYLSGQSFQEHLQEVLQGTPNYIKALETLRNYFSFKNTSLYVYNTRYQEMLVSLSKKDTK